MTLISRAIPSTVCVIFLFVTILSLCKLTNAGGFSFSLWGAGFNIPGNPLAGLPGFPGNNGRKRRQTIPRVNGELSSQSYQCRPSNTFEATIYERGENSIEQCDEIVYDCVARKTPR